MTNPLDPVERRGAIADAAAPVDQQAISDVMNQVEQSNRPGMVVLYYNGTNWLITEQRLARWLPRARTG